MSRPLRIDRPGGLFRERGLNAGCFGAFLLTCRHGSRNLGSLPTDGELNMSIRRRGNALWRSALVLLIGTLPAQALPFSEYNKTIARLGAQETFYYAAFNEPFGQNCQWGNVYVLADRKGLYAQLLVAKVTGKRVSRLDYSQPGGSGTQCYVELVELAD